MINNLRKFKTPERLEKITRVVKDRQHSLTVVLENIHDPHNVSAIFRTCDAVGINEASLVYNYEKYPKIGKSSSASAYKWVGKNKFESIDECYSKLRERGFKIYASILDKNAVDLYELDLTEKSAIVIGNEHRGISKEAAELADKTFYIPMHGMIQSLNVSVAAAVSIYEALRQRKIKGMYPSKDLHENEIEKIIDEWCDK